MQVAPMAPQVTPPLKNIIIICTILPKVQHAFQFKLPKGIQSMWPLHLSWLHVSLGIEHAQRLVSFLKCIEPLRVAPGRSPKKRCGFGSEKRKQFLPWERFVCFVFVSVCSDVMKHFSSPMHRQIMGGVQNSKLWGETSEPASIFLWVTALVALQAQCHWAHDGLYGSHVPETYFWEQWHPQEAPPTSAAWLWVHSSSSFAWVLTKNIVMCPSLPQGQQVNVACPFWPPNPFCHLLFF